MSALSSGHRIASSCRAVSQLPLIVCMAFDTDRDGGRTVMGNTARDCAARLTAEGAEAVGAHCGGIDPDQMACVVATLTTSTTLRVVTEPNAGSPALVGGKTHFDMGPGRLWQRDLCHHGGSLHPRGIQVGST